jgi:hypothetical protein
MRLINTATLELQEFLGSMIPSYAILSHTWGDEEVELHEMQNRTDGTAAKLGFSKILRCCQMAASDGLEWAWVDTCCIDKKSSAKLTEAINSMFKWYENTKICYVYLADLANGKSFTSPAFSACRWFTRGVSCPQSQPGQEVMTVTDHSG